MIMGWDAETRKCQKSNKKEILFLVFSLTMVGNQFYFCTHAVSSSDQLYFGRGQLYRGILLGQQWRFLG